MIGTIILVSITAGFAAVTVALGLRLSKVMGELAELKAAHGATQADLDRATRSNSEQGQRLGLQLTALRGELATLEADLEACTEPGARRARIERLFTLAGVPQ